MPNLGPLNLNAQRNGMKIFLQSGHINVFIPKGQTILHYRSVSPVKKVSTMSQNTPPESKLQ